MTLENMKTLEDAGTLAKEILGDVEISHIDQFWNDATLSFLRVPLVAFVDNETFLSENGFPKNMESASNLLNMAAKDLRHELLAEEAQFFNRLKEASPHMALELSHLDGASEKTVINVLEYAQTALRVYIKRK